MAYLKPQSPLQKGTDYIYPLTTADQVLVGDEERLNAKLSSAVYLDSSTTEDGAPESVNADMLGGKPAGYYTQPYNLLDNSDFTNPVNQRGSATYTGTYGIDRWRCWDSDSITDWQKNGGVGVEVNGAMFQYFPRGTLSGIHTLTAKKTDGTILIYSGYIDSEYDNPNNSLYFGDDGNAIVVALPTGTYLWAALYEGEYTPETLPPYRPKGYAAELAECKRYFQFVCLTAIKTTGSFYAICYNHGMRIVPSCELAQFSPYGNANVTDMSGCSIVSDIGSLVYATLPTCTAHDVGGLCAYLHADL